MEVVNDNSCSWVNDLSPRNSIKKLSTNLKSEWLIIGAGYTGLSAARKLGQLYPNQKILLVDAQLAGEGASSRNSGYLVDTTLNDGFTSNKELENYKKKADIYKLGIEVVKRFIKEHQVDCDCGLKGVTVRTMDETTAAIKQSCEDQKNGITTFIEVILNQELGEPFRRDAMKKPVKVAGINKNDMKPQKSLNG